MTDTRKEALLQALARFARQRPGLDPRNYGDWRTYRAESRAITRDLHICERLMGAVTWRDSLTADDIIAASRTAYSGRLEITEPEPGVFTLQYCAGQYQPREYRAAVCAVLAQALWWYAMCNMPTPEQRNGRDYYLDDRGRLVSGGEWLRRRFRHEFGADIQRRFFD